MPPDPVVAPALELAVVWPVAPLVWPAVAPPLVYAPVVRPAVVPPLVWPVARPVVAPPLVALPPMPPPLVEPAVDLPVLSLVPVAVVEAPLLQAAPQAATSASQTVRRELTPPSNDSRLFLARKSTTVIRALSLERWPSMRHRADELASRGNAAARAET